jgi:hypothetical protein
VGTFGALLESFVFSEVLKLMTASDLRLTPHHFRDRDMREVDIVLERDDGMIAGIEVKASATVKAGDFGGLRALAEACGDRFAFGVVLYDSADVVPFGDKAGGGAIVVFVGNGNRPLPAVGPSQLEAENKHVTPPTPEGFCRPRLKPRPRPAGLRLEAI